MPIKPTYLVALLLASAGFVMTGGVSAAEQAAHSEEAASNSASAQAQARSDASIPFVNHGGVRDWKSVGDDVIYVQDAHRNWYRATLMGPSPDLPFATAIGFETRGLDRLDRFSSILISGRRYAIKSFTTSGPPPKAAKEGKAVTGEVPGKAAKGAAAPPK